VSDSSTKLTRSQSPAESARRVYLHFLTRRCGLTLRDVATLAEVAFVTARAWSCAQRSIPAARLRQLLAALEEAGYPPPPLPPPGVLDD
jgi:hypothetical protein